MLSKMVLKEIDQFENPDRLQAAAEKVADRLNGQTNRLKLVSELKFIQEVIAGEPVQMTAMVRNVDQQSISDGVRELREALDQLFDAKTALNDFLRTRLSGLMLPERGTEAIAGALAVGIGEASPLTNDLLSMSNQIRSATSDLQSIKNEINARLLT